MEPLVAPQSKLLLPPGSPLPDVHVCLCDVEFERDVMHEPGKEVIPRCMMGNVGQVATFADTKVDRQQIDKKSIW